MLDEAISLLRNGESETAVLILKDLEKLAMFDVTFRIKWRNIFRIIWRNINKIFNNGSEESDRESISEEILQEVKKKFVDV